MLGLVSGMIDSGRSARVQQPAIDENGSREQLLCLRRSSRGSRCQLEIKSIERPVDDQRPHPVSSAQANLLNIYFYLTIR